MPLSRRVAPLLVVAGLLAPATAVAAPSPSTCPPGVGVGLVEIPKGTKDPRAKEYVVDHVAPGAHFSRRFQVCNGTSKPLRLVLYAGAAHVANGSFLIDAGHAVNELSGWIRVEPSTLTVAPGQRALARATFAVPADAEQGERYAVLVAERPAPPGTPGIPVTSRVGVRVYLDVGPGGAEKSDFAVDSLQASRTVDGKGQVTAQVHNTGKRAIDITGSLSLRDGPGGQTGGPYPARLGTTLAPAETEPVIVPIDLAISDGPWTARLTLTSGLVERRVQAELTFPSVPGTSAAPVDVEKLPAASENEIRPGRSLALVLLALLSMAGLAAVRRRRSGRTADESGAP
ncbi:MAG: hypothetical protein QOJ79_1412 [Actinomycetota bacterium]|nr:hypothetical protein [Actinomycetota bacterium]